MWACLAVACGEAAPEDTDRGDTGTEDTDTDTAETDTDSGDTDDTGSDDAEVSLEELVTFQVRGGAGFQDIAPGGLTFGDGDALVVVPGRGEHRARTPIGAVPMPDGSRAWVPGGEAASVFPGLGLQAWAADAEIFSALYDDCSVEVRSGVATLPWKITCCERPVLRAPGIVELEVVPGSADRACEVATTLPDGTVERVPLEPGVRLVDVRSLTPLVSSVLPGKGARVAGGGTFNAVWMENPASAGGRSFTLSYFGEGGFLPIRTLNLEPIGDCANLEIHDLSVTLGGDIYLVGSFCGRLSGLGSSAGAPIEATSDELLLVALDSEGNQRFGRKGGGMSVERVAGVGRGSGKVSIQSFSIGDMPSFAPSCAETVETKAGLWMLDLSKVPAEGPIPVTCVGPRRGSVIAGQYFTVEPLADVGANAVLVRSETRAQVVDTDGKDVTVYAAWDLDGGVRFDASFATLVDGEIELPVCVAPGSELREGSDPPGPVLNKPTAVCGRSRARIARNAR
jgi:hypothetical protein